MDKKTQLQNMEGILLQATQKVFPEILTVNLTKGTYRMVSYHSDTTLGTPQEGRFDDMIRIRLSGVVAADRDSFSNTFSLSSLRKAFLEDGRESVSLTYRRPGKGNTQYWFETTVTRQYIDAGDDVLLVAMSRSINAQKAEEARLREQLWLQAEEIRITTGRMRRTICYYDISTKTLTVPDDYARKNGIAKTIRNYPDSIHADSSGYLEDTLPTLFRFYHSILQGDPSGSCELAFIHPEKGVIWKRWEFAMVYDRNSNPYRAVIFVEDITAQRLQASELQETKENEQILRLTAQHSERTICYYDLRKQRSRVWDPSTCAKCQLPHLCDHSLEHILTSGDILPESVEPLRDMFLDIHNGSPNGSMKLRVKGREKPQWFDLQYTTIFDEENKPISALISHKDITEQYEHELAYLHQAQMLRESKHHLGTLELDLETDLIESQGGKMLPGDTSVVGSKMADFGQQMVLLKLAEQDQPDGLLFFSSEYLSGQYAAGHRQLERLWKMRIRDSWGWVRTEVNLIVDPYTKHRKAFFRLTDITSEKNAQLEAQSRSEQDSMTGLYNRAAAEFRIRQLMAKRENAGILLLLDLDDLKQINDIFGHGEGDRAIIGISKTLKSHFRDTDIIARIGGDEFMIYLTGAAENPDAIAASLSSLLRKITTLSVGAEQQRRVHCSVGCAVQSEDLASFEALYKQADVALYHVKRNSKNNFAFYTPNMLQEDYQFRSQRLLSLQGRKMLENTELQHLLAAIAEIYQLVLSMNLSTNDYFLMGEIENGIFSALPAFGIMDQFVDLVQQHVHPEDAPGFMEHLSRESLIAAYSKGARHVRHRYRYRFENTYRWTEAFAIFYTNANGDVCDFTLVRWSD